MPKISILSPLIISILFMTSQLFGIYKWNEYKDDPRFRILKDKIDGGQLIYHQSAKNKWKKSGNKGLLFNVKLFTFPSSSASYAWMDTHDKKGKISFYPYIHTFDDGTSTLSLAIMYYLERGSSTKRAYGAPSFMHDSLIRLETETIIFTKLKFVSEKSSTIVNLDTKKQTKEIYSSGSYIHYIYWLKAELKQSEFIGLKNFFNRPITYFEIRGYSDKGHLDAMIKGKQLKVLKEIFVSTIDLHKKLIDPAQNPLLLKNQPIIITNTITNTLAPVTNTITNNISPAIRKRKVIRTEPQTVKKNIIITNQRPKTIRIATPQ